MAAERTGKGFRDASSPLSTKINILWASKLSPLHRKLSFWVIREICDYIRDVQQVIAVLKDQVKCFNVATSEWEQFLTLRRNINVDCTTASIFTSPSTIFVCGGGKSPCTCHVDNKAYMLEGDGSVQELPDMSTARRGPGLACDSSRLYVFGGYDSNGTSYTDVLNSSEMCILSRWTPLPNMHQARSWFNPCWNSSLLYLCGGCETDSVETYNPRSNIFVLLDFTLPERTWTTTVVERGVITVICQEHISKLQQGRLISQRHGLNVPWSSCSPIVSGGGVYVYYDGTCRCIDLTTGAVQKAVRLT